MNTLNQVRDFSNSQYVVRNLTETTIQGTATGRYYQYQKDTHPIIEELFDKTFDLENKTLPSLVLATGKKRREKDLNLGNLKKIPREILQKTLSYLNPQELSRLMIVCTATSKEVALIAKQQIKEIIKYAYQCDEEIKRLTNHQAILVGSNKLNSELSEIEKRLRVTFFRFDQSRWEQVIDDLEKTQKKGFIVANATHLVDECRLDLIEALAEYNVERFHILNDQDIYDQEYAKERPLHASTEHRWAFARKNRFLSLIFQKVDRRAFSPTFAEILDEAKKTCKMSLYIENCIGFNSQIAPDAIFGRKAEHCKEGPYFVLHLSNCESIKENSYLEDNGNGMLPSYRRFKHDLWTLRFSKMNIHLDWLAGKRKGERLVIPPGDHQPEQVVCRLNQDNIEEKILNGLYKIEDRIAHQVKNVDNGLLEERSLQEKKKLSLKRLELGTKYLKRRCEIFQKIEKAYGNDFINKKKTDWNLEDFHREWEIPNNLNR